MASFTGSGHFCVARTELAATGAAGLIGKERRPKPDATIPFSKQEAPAKRRATGASLAQAPIVEGLPRHALKSYYDFAAFSVTWAQLCSAKLKT